VLYLLAFSHNLPSRFDPKSSHIKYVTPNIMTMKVSQGDSIKLTSVCRVLDFLVTEKNWLTICITQRSMVQIILCEKTLVVWLNTRTTNPSCMSGKSKYGYPVSIPRCLEFWVYGLPGRFCFVLNPTKESYKRVLKKRVLCTDWRAFVPRPVKKPYYKLLYESPIKETHKGAIKEHVQEPYFSYDVLFLLYYCSRSSTR